MMALITSGERPSPRRASRPALARTSPSLLQIFAEQTWSTLNRGSVCLQWFVCRGTGPGIPKFLRFQGKVRPDQWLRFLRRLIYLVICITLCTTRTFEVYLLAGSMWSMIQYISLDQPGMHVHVLALQVRNRNMQKGDCEKLISGVVQEFNSGHHIHATH